MRKQAKREARRKTGAGGTGASSSTCEVHRLGGASSAQHARSTPALTATAGRRPAPCRRPTCSGARAASRCSRPAARARCSSGPALLENARVRTPGVTPELSRAINTLCPVRAACRWSRPPARGPRAPLRLRICIQHRMLNGIREIYSKISNSLYL